jgi:cell division septation protein DedD
MPTATSEDTEITLGTGKMLALFFALVALCAVFFAVGFTLGKEAALKPSAAAAMPASSPTAVLRPATVKTSSRQPAAADSSERPADNQPVSSNTAAATSNSPDSATAAPPADPAAPPVLNGYYVQVAAVSKQEDADALVDALKSKQYPAFSATAMSDKLFHVQCGPYADIKDAEAMRTKLTSDGYNPILKK